MKYVWKARDFFYNNGIVNLFWATQQTYDLPYLESENGLMLKSDNGLVLTLLPNQMMIEGNEADIKEWYLKISRFFIRLGLEETPRLVFDKNSKSLKEGFSYKQRPFTYRIWGTAIGSKLISSPSLDKNISKNLVRHALKSYLEKSGKDLNELDKKGLFKKKWEKEGVYVQVSFQTIFENLLKNRHQFKNSDKEKCEICGSNITRYNGETYKRDSQTYPTVIGLGYSGFKEFMHPEKMVVCAFCDIALRYNFFWSFYAGGKMNILLHLDFPDLISLYRLKAEVFDIKMENTTNIDQATNIPFPDIKYFVSPERAIIGLALYVTKRITSEASFAIDYVTGEKGNFLKIVSFYFDSTQIKGLTEYNKFNRLVQWLSQLHPKAISKPLRNNSFRINSRNNQYLIETEFLRNLIEFKDVSASLAEIAFLKIRGEKIKNATTSQSISPYPLDSDFEDLIVSFYKNIEEPIMNENHLQLLKDYGWALGTLAKEVDDLSIFYELREAKKLDHVLNVLRNFSFKLLRSEQSILNSNDYVKSALARFVGKDLEIVKLFEEMKDQWMKARDLLLFFAVNNYLKKYNTK